MFAEFTRHFEAFPEDKMFLWEADAYQYALWLMGLAVLFGLPDVPPQIATWFSHAPDDGNDPLIARLFARLGVPGIPPGKELIHPKPYAHLFEAVCAPSGEAKAAALKEYLKHWYKGTKDCYWHDRHKNPGLIHFGYWAFEAGMVAVLYGIDDSAIRDMTFYPKDLVDAAREQNFAARFAPPQAPAPRAARPGEPCPETGEWFAVHLGGKTVRLNAGDPMPGPAFGPSGEVIWYLKQEK